MSEGSLNPKAIWWLDESRLPDRFLWARLEQLRGMVVVKDCDGHFHHFPDYDQAKLWLLEDEYQQLSHLIADGVLPAGTSPPGDF